LRFQALTFLYNKKFKE